MLSNVTCYVQKYITPSQNTEHLVLLCNKISTYVGPLLFLHMTNKNSVKTGLP